jgi:hypothetical protein
MSTPIKFNDKDLNDYFEKHFKNPENPMPINGNEDEINKFMDNLIRNAIRNPTIHEKQ